MIQTNGHRAGNYKGITSRCMVDEEISNIKLTLNFIYRVSIINKHRIQLKNETAEEKISLKVKTIFS